MKSMFFLAVSLLPLSMVQITPKRVPEVLVILLDDTGKDLLSAADTPNIDTLANNGMTFSRAWAMPTCSPTRASVLTGEYPYRHGIGSIVSVNDDFAVGLRYSETLLPEMLKFATGAFGKWHLGHPLEHTNESGFTYFAGNRFNLGGEDNNGYYDWNKVVQGKESQCTTYAVLETTEEALWASRLRFRYVAYNAAHKPWNNKGEPPGYDVPNGYETAIAQLEYTDTQIGRLLEDFSGYVFLLGDNGTPSVFGGGKTTLREAGINVPFIVSGPGVLPGTSDELVGVVDIFATVCDIYGIDLPNGVARDSISLLPLLGGIPVSDREYLFAESFPNNHDYTTSRSVAISNDTHKLTIEQGVETLYLMPGETVVPTPYTGVELSAYNELFSELQQNYAW